MDGFETPIGVNHMEHFLRPALLLHRPCDGWETYAHSKLANILHTLRGCHAPLALDRGSSLTDQAALDVQVHSPEASMFFHKTPSIPEVSVHEVHEGQGLILIDVREEHELVGELGAIEGIQHIPLGTLLQNGLPPEIPTESALVIVCKSGGRSGHATLALAQNGYSNAKNMAGGMIAWNRAGLPLRG